jgi:glycosyltransferase involved in cell wall biosynthesis
VNPSHRILYVENVNGVGGSIVSIHRLVQALDRQRYEPIILFHRPNAYESRFHDLGITVVVLDHKAAAAAKCAARPRDIAGSLSHYHPGLAHTYRWLKSIYLFGRQTLPQAWQIRRVIETHSIDLVHLNNRVGDNRSGILAAWLTHKPCVCHLRDFDRPTWLDRTLVKSVDYFASMSSALDQNLRAAVPTLRGSVVYDGLELEAFQNLRGKSHVRPQFGLSDGDFVVGHVGRLVPWKGHEVFLRAIARIAPQVPELKVLIVGEPDPPTDTRYLRQLQSLAQELGLVDIVRFTGFCADIPAVMTALDVLVHSSTSPEPFGLVVIEGMAAGKPVIATRAGGVLDIVQEGQTGLLTPVGDEQALAEPILTLARHRDLAARLGAEARRRVAARFTAAQYAQTVQAIYDSLLEIDRDDPESVRTIKASPEAAGQMVFE